ncbi:hypothetical protein Krac_1424 [Ktedonobacter racemifer DSM 44963]|uniref:Uncharacterized protein n=1 Tax=Ktedonobacter racemifer DSM 44963 TaxID=485913 RepID=D6U1F0_KTERA|nr:hypothetical protein Krac_1424 [Ktedonobacter racemifer DSM 44963]
MLALCHKICFLVKPIAKLTVSVEVRVEQSLSANPTVAPASLSRTQRAHSRLSWTVRLARNAREPSAPAVALTLFGVPSATAYILGLGTI